ncbi:hypothetical protein GCM10018980_48420 [Streptomyces capoamus]|uniref:Uncharacterized protein n=1 Tax=Streptomyces capoamus TaxID=68183 RepID=A0A919KCJ8_9ACTN|nr:hypothetical protein GCM10018980_48420 [Streptomyces capoamus]
MVTARPRNAALISASCWAQAGYSAGLRSAQTGSPMMWTRRPGGWVSAKARSTPGMIRPGLRPASRMSRKRTVAPSAPSSSWISRRLSPGTAIATGSSAASAARTKGTVPARYSPASP